MTKKILLAAFIFPERVEWFLSYLKNKFNIDKKFVFCFKNLDDESKVIVTFKITLTDDKPLDLKNLFPSALPIHKKGSTIYTINALNKLIEETNPNSIGNIDYKSIKINWDDYKDKFILTNNNKLTFLNITRIF
jgi:hypothetical protein